MLTATLFDIQCNPITAELFAAAIAHIRQYASDTGQRAIAIVHLHEDVCHDELIMEAADELRVSTLDIVAALVTMWLAEGSA